MAIYYIRKSGSDSNNGLTPATAWQTISKAAGASGISSGDTVYIGAGTYREKITFNLTNPIAETSFIGDPAGEFTGDAGEVRLTNYLTDDVTLPTAQQMMILNGKSHLTFENLYFQYVNIGDGTGVRPIDSETPGSAYITFRNCMFFCVEGGGGSSNIITVHGVDDMPLHWLIEKCRFIGEGFGRCIVIGLAPGTIADYDADFIIRNCSIGGFFDSYGISVGLLAPGDFRGGGVKAINCTTWGNVENFFIAFDTSTSIPCEAYGNHLLGMGYGRAFRAGTLGELIEDYNVIFAYGSPRLNVDAGANSIADGSYAPLIFFGQEILQGLNPQPFMMPTSDSPLLGFGGGNPPADDLLGAIRPNPAAVGAIEYQSFECDDSGGNAGMNLGGGLSYG